MKYFRAVALFIPLLLLTGCGPLRILNADTGGYVPMQGGTFVLHESVVIPAGRARMFFQDGALATGMDHFRPHCQLSISTLSDQPQTIEPDRFGITAISNRTDQVVQSGSIQVASVGFYVGVGVGNSGGGGPSRVMRVFLFRLQSERQPDVRTLICGGAFDDPSDADAPTLQDIATALGDYGTLELR